jgi:NTP pyrophosphatase (non-canonical NTP hydrolase)
MSLRFSTLRNVNLARCAGDGWNHPLELWSIDDWFVAVGGELGEALNIVKKLNRDRDGIGGNAKPHEQLIEELGDELADAVIYLDLFLARVGTSFEQLSMDKGFVELRNFTAAYPDDGTASTIARKAMRQLGQLNDDGTGAMLLLQCIDQLACAFDIDLGRATVCKFNSTSEKHGMRHRLPEAA